MKDAILAYLRSLIKHHEPVPLSMTVQEESCLTGPNGKPTPGQHRESVQVEYAYA